MIDNRLQKLIDMRLGDLKPTPDRVCNYYYDYSHCNTEIALLLRKTKISKEDFTKLNISKLDVKNAIVNSPVVDDIIAKYRNAIVTGLSPVFFQELREEADDLKYEEQWEAKNRQHNEIRKAALRKLAKVGLSKKEKKSLGLLGSL